MFESPQEGVAPAEHHVALHVGGLVHVVTLVLELDSTLNHVHESHAVLQILRVEDVLGDRVDEGGDVHLESVRQGHYGLLEFRILVYYQVGVGLLELVDVELLVREALMGL